jgi:hypothetical protein
LFLPLRRKGAKFNKEITIRFLQQRRKGAKKHEEKLNKVESLNCAIAIVDAQRKRP